MVAGTYVFQITISEETFSDEVVRDDLTFNIIVEDGGATTTCEISPYSTSYSASDSYDFNDEEGKTI